MAAVIFDFDGTIADSFDAVVDVFKHLTGSPQPLTTEEISHLRGKPLKQVAQRLGVPVWKLPFLLFRGRQIMSNYIPGLHLFEGMGKVIEELHAEGHEVYIMSSNSTRNVKKFLRQHHLYKYFVDIRGGAGLFSKSSSLKTMLKRNNLEAKDCFYIGDETRDIEAAHEVGMRSIAVTWGFADTVFLEETQPSAMATTPQQIITILEEL